MPAVAGLPAVDPRRRGAPLSTVMSHWYVISRFGESSLLLPCAALLYLWMHYAGEPRAARNWLACFAGAAALTLASKLAFMGWGIGVQALDFTGFSGHSMMAAAVLPVLGQRLVATRRPGLAAIGMLAGGGMALLVGYSRLMLDAHTPSEVVGGLSIGLAASLGFLRLCGTAPRSAAPVTVALAIATLMLGLPATGAHAPTHRWLEQLAVYLSGRDRPFRREDWPASTALRAPRPGDGARLLRLDPTGTRPRAARQ